MGPLKLLLAFVFAAASAASAASALLLAGTSVCASLCGLRAILSGCAEAGASAAALAAAAVAMVGLGGLPACMRTLAFLLAAALALLHAWLAAPSPQVWAAAAEQVQSSARLRQLVHAGLLPQCSVDGARDALLLLSALRHVASAWAWLAAGLRTLHDAAAAQAALARPPPVAAAAALPAPSSLPGSVLRFLGSLVPAPPAVV